MKIVELEQEAMMGEFEDYILNEAIDRADGISPQVWGDEEILTAPITCRRCGTGGLHWQETEHRWRLFTSEWRMHRCSVHPLEESET